MLKQEITKNCFYFLFVTFGLAYAQIELNQEILQKEFNMMPTVTAIELTANDIRSIQPNTFKGYSKLEQLYLVSNQLVSVDSKLFNGLNNLKEISLRDNHLIKLSPGTFNGLTKLIELQLSSNQFKDLDENIFNGLVSLERLHLFSNKISKLNKEIFKDLKNLKQLYLYSNMLTSIEPTTINRLSKLNFLRLEYNKLTTVKADTFVSSIQELYLHSNNLTGKLESFSKITSLKVLQLESNRINNFDKTMLTGLKNLEKICLFSNPIASSLNQKDICPKESKNCKLETKTSCLV